MKLLAFVLSQLIFMFVFVNPTFASEKRVEVDLTNQRIYAYDKEKVIYNFPVSSGKWAPTPTGTFKPWIKLASTRMRGGNPKLGTYYNLANVPYVVYFYQGYAIHGAYWHNNFGRPMSHGCVNVSPDQAKLIYNFIEMDTPIKIYGAAPKG